jgi:hypothetical protein
MNGCADLRRPSTPRANSSVGGRPAETEVIEWAASGADNCEGQTQEKSNETGDAMTRIGAIRIERFA